MQTLTKSENILQVLNLFAKKGLCLFTTVPKQPALFRTANNV